MAIPTTLLNVTDGAPSIVREVEVQVKHRGRATQWKVRGAMDIDYYLRSMKRLSREHFVVLHLDARARVVGRETVSVGTVTAALVHPREVFRGAIVSGATSIVVVHNHPSGDPTPSPEDRDVTRRLVAAGKLIGIPVLDHIVIAADAFYSFANEGEI